MSIELYEKYLGKALEIIDHLKDVFQNAKKSKPTFNLKSSSNDLVTETDKKLEDIIKSRIKSEFPNHLFIGEESSYENKIKYTDETTWIVDPLDGTINFVHSFQFHCVSIAVTYKKEIIVAVVFIPEENKLFHAIRGGGSFLNGNPINVSISKDKTSCLLVTEWGSGSDEDMLLKSHVMRKLITGPERIHGLRSFGSAAINSCMVACGAVDCYYEWGCHCWDIAAGSLIVTEAGGSIATIGGGKFDAMSRKYIFASSTELLNQIDEIIGEINIEPDDG